MIAETPLRQTTSGPNSPNVQAQGSVNISYGYTRAEVVRAVEEVRSDEGPDTAALSGLIQRGHYTQAQALIDQIVARKAPQIRKIADLQYLKGVTLTVQRRLGEAEAAYRAALSLIPGDCRYLSGYAWSLVPLDRPYDLEQLVGAGATPAATCLAHGAPETRIYLALATVRIAMEHRDKALASTYTSIAVAAVRLLDESRLPSASLWRRAYINCEVARTLAVFWQSRDNLEETWLLPSTECSRLIGELGKVRDQLNRFARIVTNTEWSDEIPREDPRFGRRFDEAIGFIQSFGTIGQLGYTEIDRDLTLAAVYRDGGFWNLWSMRRPQLTKPDYERAYQMLRSLSLSGRADALTAWAHLASTVVFFEYTQPQAPIFPDTYQQVAADMDELLTAPVEMDQSSDKCEAYINMLDILNQYSRLEQRKGLRERLQNRAGSCVAKLTQPHSLRHEELSAKLSIRLAMPLVRNHEAKAAIPQLTEQIDTQRRLSGFPLYQEQDPSYRAGLQSRGALYLETQDFTAAKADFAEDLLLEDRFDSDNPINVQDARSNLALAELSLDHYDAAEHLYTEVETAQAAARKSGRDCLELMRFWTTERSLVSIALSREDPRSALERLDRETSWIQKEPGCRDVYPRTPPGESYSPIEATAMIVLLDMKTAEQLLRMHVDELAQHNYSELHHQAETLRADMLKQGVSAQDFAQFYALTNWIRGWSDRAKKQPE